MPEHFDVVVIGGGPAGEHFAAHARAAGFSVAIVEGELVGGECSYWACMPSKALLRPTQVLEEARRVPGAASAVTRGVDVAAALGRRDWITAGWHDDGQVAWLENEAITLIRGHGRLAGRLQVAVEASDGTVTSVSASRAVVVAAGSVLVIPPIEGLAEAMSWTSREITSAREAPRRLIIIGGGVVGAEMALAWHRLGSEEVTIIEGGDRLVANLEPFASSELKASFEHLGIAVRTHCMVTAVHRKADGSAVTVKLSSGEEIVSDEVVVAVGRRPNTGDIGLETVGLEPGRAIPVDDSLSARGVEGNWLYAIGDANGRVQLTHMGKYQARVLARVLAGDEVLAESDHAAVSSVIFTDPEIASVGLTEEMATDHGLNVRTLRVDLGSVAAASIWGEGLSGTCQLVVDTDADVIVGATFVGPAVGEMLHAATVAIVGAVPLERLRHAVAAFPTLSEIWLELIEQYFASPS